MKAAGIFLVAVLCLAIGAQAQDASISFRTGELVGPWCPIMGPNGVDPLPDSSYIGIYLTGPDGEVDPPGPNGIPTDDDVRATNNAIGNGMDHLIIHPGEPGSIPEGNLFIANGNVIFPPAGSGIEPIVNQSDTMYLRAFNSIDPATATHYNDIYTVDGVVQNTFVKLDATPQVVIVCFTDAMPLPLGPIISVIPDTLDFGTVLVGELEELDLTIYSLGDENLILYDIISSNPYFTTNFDPSDSLIAPGDSLIVTVGFAPLQPGEYQDTLQILNNEATVEVRLLGDAYVLFPEISLSTDALDFDTVTVGETSELPLTIYNVGDATLVVYDISNSNACFTHDFSISDSLIAPGDSLIVTVTFAPLEQLLYEDTLRIDNNDEMAEVLLSGVGEILGVSLGNTSNIPETFSLKHPYPNPFNAVTCLSYDVPVSGMVRVEVYDVLGKKVATLVDGNVNAGSFQVRWDARAMPSGIYFVSMAAGEFWQIRKLVLLK